MKKFTEYNNITEEVQQPEQVVAKPQPVAMLESFVKTYSELNKSIETAKQYIEQFEYISSDFAKKEEVENLFASQLMVVSENLNYLKKELKSINEDDITRINNIVSDLDNKTQELSSYIIEELPKTKKDIIALEFNANKNTKLLDESINKVEEKTKEITDYINTELISKEHFSAIEFNTTKNSQLIEKINETITEKVSQLHESLKLNSEEIQILSESYDNILAPAVSKINEFQTNIDTISGLADEYKDTIEKTKQEIRSVVNEVNQIFINENYLELDKKLQRVEEMFNAKVQQLNEEQDKPDAPTISPVQQGFDPGQVSSLALKVKFLEQSIGRIVATGPGGGEVNLRWLDDVDRSTIGDGKYLRYNNTKKKFEFVTLSGSGTEVDTLDSVTDRGNTTTNGITVGNATADYFQLDITPATTPTITTGMIAWNDQDKTFDMGLLNGVILQAGQEMHIYVKAYETISDGQAVMFAGAEGENILVRKYDPSVVGFIPEWFVGVATQNLAHNAFGYVTVYGKVRGLNTNAYNNGDILYANNAVAGGLTATPPSPGNPHIIVAAVTKKSGGDGHIMVRPNIRPGLADLPDVNITSPSNGQVLKFNGSYWINAADATGAGGSGIALTDLSVNTTTASSGGSLSYNNGTGVFTFAPASVPAAQIQSDWTQTNTSLLDYIKNKPTLATVATSGSYTDLSNKPSIPSLTGYATESYVTTQITNLINGAPGTLDTLKEIADQLATDESAVSALTSTVASKIGLTNLSVSTASASGSGSLSYNNTSGVFTFTPPVLFSGSYNDLTNKPTIPTVYDSTITITAGTGMSGGGTFTLNQSTPTTVTLNSTITQYTDTLARSAITLSTGSSTNGGALSYNSTTGAFTFQPATTYTLPTASGSVLGGIKVGSGLSIDGSGVLTTTIQSGGNATFNNITTTGQIIETFQTYSTSIGATQPITLDCTGGNVFDITSTVTQNWTAAFTNLALSTGKVTNTTLIINQGTTPYIPTAININGTNGITINWQGGTQPTGSASKKDVIAFSILQTGASTYLVFGQLVSFG